MLNEKQKAVVDSTHARILVCAGPGAGKSSTLIARIKRMVSDGVKPESILAVSFTNAAANVMRERLEGLPVICTTLHGFLLRHLMAYGTTIKLAKQLTVMDEDLREEQIQAAMKRLRYKGTVKAVTEQLDKGVLYFMDKQHDPRMNACELVAFDYYSTMIQRGLLDYDSILQLGYRLTKTLGSNIGIGSPIRHLFCDESQDGNAMDFQIYEAMQLDSRMFIGDFDQSIYKFRGACPEAMLAESKRTDTEVHILDTNYRSDFAICDAANRLIAHNKNRLPKETIPHSQAAGRVTIWRDSRTDFHEATKIAAGILELVDMGIEPKEIAVLARNNYIVDQLAKTLEGLCIPIARRRSGLPQGWNVARAFINYIGAPSNDTLALRFLRLSKDAATADLASREAQMKFTTVNEVTFKYPRLLLADQVRALAAVNLSHLPECVRLIQETAATLDAEASITELQFALNNREELRPETGDGVTVATVHGVKGKEFDHVFIAACDDQIIPGDKADECEENRRVLYVAITRARHSVTLSTVNTRMLQWSRTPVAMMPSRFLKEIEA